VVIFELIHVAPIDQLSRSVNRVVIRDESSVLSLRAKHGLEMPHHCVDGVVGDAVIIRQYSTAAMSTLGGDSHVHHPGKCCELDYDY